MRYEFLIETYETERIKVSASGASFATKTYLCVRVPTTRADAASGSSWVHQCVSEDLWFRTMLGIDVSAPPLPAQETRLDFIKRYAEDSAKRLQALKEKPESWFEEETKFFDVARSRAWVLTRRLTHTSHHRGQQMAMLRMLGRDLHSNYGPTADTGGLMQNHGAHNFTLTTESKHCCRASHAAERRLTCQHRPAELSPSEAELSLAAGAIFACTPKVPSSRPTPKSARTSNYDTSRKLFFQPLQLGRSLYTIYG